MVGEAAAAQLKTMAVGKIAGRFVVPDYQRGYRWGVDEVTRLLDDIAASDGNYYLQPVVVKESDDAWELIDGQQRLTTLFLILEHLRTHLPSIERRYTLSYDTRPGSADYLVNPVEDASHDNIDYFFIHQAAVQIQRWFQRAEDRALAAMNFYKALGERVFIIWYEAPSDVDSRVLFTRLNVGRIPLTNAELVKAVLLSSTNRPEEVAAQWDSIERDLRNPEVWAFATGSDQSQATHISLLLDTLARRHRADDGQPFHTFETLRTLAVEQSADTVWEQIVHLHSLVRGWHDDHNLFHKIGYLTSTGSTLDDFVGPAFTSGRAEFEGVLDDQIRTRLDLTAAELAELDYELSYRQCGLVLELVNVETVRRRMDRSHRYSFDAHAAHSWSLEHIHAQSAEQLDEVRQWASWLAQHRDALAGLPSLSDAERDALVERIDAAIPTINATTFRALEQEIVPLFSLEGSNSDGVHTISNLALLERGDNSVLGNSCFEVKRRAILELDRVGRYVPPSTRNVFLKYYTDADAQQVHFWSLQDRDAYLAELRATVTPYLQPEASDG